MLVVPIREEGAGPVRGVVQVLNRDAATRRAEAPFDEEDERTSSRSRRSSRARFSLTTLRPAEPSSAGLTLRGPFNRIVGRSDELRAVYERVHARRADRRDGAPARRDRHRQGPVFPGDPRQLGAPGRAVRHRRLHDAAGAARRERALRSRARRVHRRRPSRARQGRDGRRAARSSSTRSAISRSTCRASSFASCRSARSSASAGGRRCSADVRVVCATHQDLERLVAEGKFREDLYYRIRVVEIEIPPLARARRTARSSSSRSTSRTCTRSATGGRRRSCRREALAVLRAHTWPGNVRELEHWIESAVVLAPDGRIGTTHLPRMRRAVGGGGSESGSGCGRGSGAGAGAGEGAGGGGDTARADASTRRRAGTCGATLDACDGNKAEAARRLEIGRNTIGRMFQPRHGSRRRRRR